MDSLFLPRAPARGSLLPYIRINTNMLLLIWSFPFPFKTFKITAKLSSQTLLSVPTLEKHRKTKSNCADSVTSNRFISYKFIITLLFLSWLVFLLYSQILFNLDPNFHWPWEDKVETVAAEAGRRAADRAPSGWWSSILDTEPSCIFIPGFYHCTTTNLYFFLTTLSLLLPLYWPSHC